jgi:hypothetical protein
MFDWYYRSCCRQQRDRTLTLQRITAVTIDACILGPFGALIVWVLTRPSLGYTVLIALIGGPLETLALRMNLRLKRGRWQTLGDRLAERVYSRRVARK